MKKFLFAVFTCLLISNGVAADILAGQEKSSLKLKYFLLSGTPEHKVFKAALAKPIDYAPAARKTIEELNGKLVSYYFEVGLARMYAIIALPDSRDMTALVYQRMSTGLMRDVEVVEIIPSENMVDIFKRANRINSLSAR